MTVKLAPYLDISVRDRLVLDSQYDIPSTPPDPEVVRACTNSEHTITAHGRPQFLSVTARKEACATIAAHRCLRTSAKGAATVAASIAHAIAYMRHRMGKPMSIKEQVEFAYQLGGAILATQRDVCEPKPAPVKTEPGLFESISEHLEILANTIIGLETDEEYGPNGELIPREYR